MKKLLTVSIVIFVGYLLFAAISFAEECNPSCSGIDECQKKIDECQKLLQISVSSTKPHEAKIADLENNIAAIEQNIATLTQELEVKKADIAKNETRLSTRQASLSVQVRDFYKKDYQPGLEYLLTVLFSQGGVEEKVRVMGYRQSLIGDEKRSIASLAVEITGLQDDKKKLEDTQNWLSGKKDNLETTLAPIKKLVADAKAYQSQLSQTVGTLSARQQELLAEKTGNFQTSVGDVPLADDPASRPDYNPGYSPAYAGFSFGAPHRKGMSQYGAWGRAKSGQSAEDILKAYYGDVELKKDYSTSINISVQGYGSYNIEDYVKRIYEVPSSWTDNGSAALKAQAVAARSYALAYTNNGSGSICATESCQVFQPGAKGGAWDDAVNATRGWVLVSGGQPFSAWYASTSGGYTNSYSSQGHSTPGEWDTKCGNQGCWTADAYEKISGSPWFYKAWYRPRYSSPSRSNPWLSKDEFADIVNAVLLYEKDNGTLPHLGQTDKSNPDTWSRDVVKNQLGGDAISDVSGISVNYSTGGYTSKVHLDTDRGGKDIDGGDFRTIFNLRAPGEIWLASSLYNIEKK